MYIKMKKEELLELIDSRNIYLFAKNSILIEAIVESKSLIKINNEPDLNYSLTLANNLNLNEFEKIYSIYSVDIKGLIKKILKSHGGGSNSPFRNLENKTEELRKQEQLKLKNSRYKFSLFDSQIFKIMDSVDINAPFISEENNLESFLKEKEYFYFDEESNTIKKEIGKPSVFSVYIDYRENKTIVSLDFYLKIFNKKLTSSDLILNNNKKCFKNVFESYDELIDFKVREAELKFKYFNSLKNSVTKNDSRITNAVRY